MSFRSLQVSAPLGPNEGFGTIVRRLARVAGFYALAAAVGAIAVLLGASVLRGWEYIQQPSSTLVVLSPVEWLLTAWGVLTAILVILLIYRSTLTMQEDDQLFLDDTESHMQQEQTDLLHKVSRLDPVVTGLGIASVVLGLVAAVALFR